MESPFLFLFTLSFEDLSHEFERVAETFLFFNDLGDENLVSGLGLTQVVHLKLEGFRCFRDRLKPRVAAS